MFDCSDKSDSGLSSLVVYEASTFYHFYFITQINQVVTLDKHCETMHQNDLA